MGDLDLAGLKAMLAEAEWAASWPHNITPPGKAAQKLCCEAVRALPALIQRIEALEEGLKPFAEAADAFNDCEQHPNGCPDSAQAGELVDLTVGDFRRARSFLTPTKGR